MKNKAFIVIAALVLGTALLFAGSAHKTGAYGSCVINNFYATPNNIVSGGTTSLTINTTGCQNLMLTGGSYTNYSVSYQQNISVGPLYNTTTFTLSGTDGYGNTTNSSTVVTIGNSNGQCAINSFYASPTTVYSGQSPTLFWSTSGCTNVSVTGPGLNSSATSDSIALGSIYTNATYTLTASSYTNSTTQTVYISVNGSNNNNNYSQPNAVTNPATDLTNSSATLNGSINSSGNSSCSYNSYYCNSGTTYYFRYGTTQAYLSNQTNSQTFSPSYSYGNGNVSAYLSNLQSNTTYYYQLIATNSYGTGYGNTLSFFTNNNGSVIPPYCYNCQNMNAITSVATNVSGTSARLNGVATASQAGATTYFEYGTSTSLGNQTSPQSVLAGTTNNYYDTVSVSPNTTYYYRIVGSANGQVFPGDIVSFYTGSAYVTPVVITPDYPVYPPIYTPTGPGVGAGSAYASLSISTQSQYITAGNSVQYTVNYQNISGQVLSGAILNVILPKGLMFNNSTQGVYTTNNTVAVALGTLAPGMSGTVSILTTADSTFVMSTNFVATATLAFTLPNRAQDSAIAYSINNYSQQNNNLAGFAFGSGFFPNSLLGWVLLLVVLFVLIMIVRYFYHSANREQAKVSQPIENHVYYNSTPPPPNNLPSDKYGDPMYH